MQRRDVILGMAASGAAMGGGTIVAAASNPNPSSFQQDDIDDFIGLSFVAGGNVSPVIVNSGRGVKSSKASYGSSARVRQLAPQ